MLWLYTLLAWECMDLRRSFFLMHPDTDRPWTQWAHDVYANKLLFWSVALGVLTVFPVICKLVSTIWCLSRLTGVHLDRYPRIERHRDATHGNHMGDRSLFRHDRVVPLDGRGVEVRKTSILPST